MNPTILLVDDNLDQLEMRQAILEREGYAVAAASSVPMALGLAGPETQAVVMDLRIPKVEQGRELIAALRARLPGALLIVLAGVPEELAAHAEAKLVNHCLRKGGGVAPLLRLLPPAPATLPQAAAAPARF